jgi:putative tributyrin esterase
MNADKYRFLRQLLLLFILALALQFPANAQTTQQSPVLNPKDADKQANTDKNEVATLKLNSNLMKREMSYQIIYPFSYKNKKESQTRYPVIYLLHGLSGHFDNWAGKSELARYAKSYNFIIVTPEGANGWYSDSATVPNDKYESYITQELIPEIDKNFRTIADRNHRFIAGLSMGGYGSIKFGLKNPEMFALVGSFSGALGAADWTEKEIGTKGSIAESILSVFGAAGSETRKQNDIFQMIRDMPAEKVKDLPFFYLACGTEDFLYKNDRDFTELLQQKKIPHEYREHPGGHDWTFWNAQVLEFLRLSEKTLK